MARCAYGEAFDRQRSCDASALYSWLATYALCNFFLVLFSWVEIWVRLYNKPVQSFGWIAIALFLCMGPYLAYGCASPMRPAALVGVPSPSPDADRRCCSTSRFPPAPCACLTAAV